MKIARCRPTRRSSSCGCSQVAGPTPRRTRTCRRRTSGRPRHELAETMADHGSAEDLFFRINTVAWISPLAIVVMHPRACEAVLQRYAEQVLRARWARYHLRAAALMKMSWRGNVRELEHVVEHAAIVVMDARRSCATAGDLLCTGRRRRTGSRLVRSRTSSVRRSPRWHTPVATSVLRPSILASSPTFYERCASTARRRQEAASHHRPAAARRSAAPQTPGLRAGAVRRADAA